MTLTISAATTPPPVVWITGASGALGQAVCAHFARQGAHLALLARQPAGLQAVGHGLATQPDRVLALPTDLLNPQAVAAARDAVLARWGRIDVAVHLAGGFTMGQAVASDGFDSALNQMLDLNLRTVLHSVAAVLPAMQGQGSGAVVNVGAASAAQGLAHMGAYAASKAALMRVTESLAAEVKGQGVRVNAVLPSTIDTPANRAAMPNADPSHWVTPDALADVIGFLASPAARAVHGVCVPVVGWA
jgi:NAD(P)-dependent dehydrogenase (short-subunit alcohol dehydrogenase family)